MHRLSRFHGALVQPDRLRDRIRLWAEEEVRGDRLPPKFDAVFKAVLYRGELPRGEVSALLAITERNARRVTSALLHVGVLASASARAPLRLTFPAALAGLDAKPLFGQVGVRITHGVMILRPRGLSRKTLLQQSTRSDAAEAAGITAILVKQTERAGYPCAYIASLIVSVALS